MHPIIVALGFFDFLVAVMLTLGHFDVIGGRFLIAPAIYLIGKGLLFPKDVASIIDIVAGLYLLLILFFGIHTFLAYIFAAYLMQKFVFSFL